MEASVVDLVASDVPLDPFMRRMIAGELHRLYFSKESTKKQKQRIKLMFADDLQHYLQIVVGMSATEAEAEAEAAESLGTTVDGLRKRRQRQHR
jgi:hypothetical protein